LTDSLKGGDPVRADALLLTYTEVRNTPEADIFDRAVKAVERIAQVTHTDPARVARRVGRVLNQLLPADQIAVLDRLRSRGLG